MHHSPDHHAVLYFGARTIKQYLFTVRRLHDRRKQGLVIGNLFRTTRWCLCGCMMMAYSRVEQPTMTDGPIGATICSTMANSLTKEVGPGRGSDLLGRLRDNPEPRTPAVVAPAETTQLLIYPMVNEEPHLPSIFVHPTVTSQCVST